MKETIENLEKTLPPSAFFSTNLQDFSYNPNTHITIECDELSLKIYGYEGRLSIDIDRTQVGLNIVEALLAKIRLLADEEYPFPWNEKIDGNAIYIVDERDFLIVTYSLVNAEHLLLERKAQDLLPEKLNSVVQTTANGFL
ncbi:hypothetical protein A6A19_01995 [Actinobacillus delphinicola]|uniref:Uncharacterized protein n=1 Tax=Actinobacillus delphinicola TaxID=51161 RepID=A0A448TRA2_9PAST|nr:hypothetical protein [Actinobacillus delphinicola]MDG6896799.1 hypothetical protein [Actinobacillus delphinicola]VEJ08607.1 Uncharacterised protein [Actinobacillus delphinicola]